MFVCFVLVVMICFARVDCSIATLQTTVDDQTSRQEYKRGFGVPTLIAVHPENDPKESWLERCFGEVGQIRDSRGAVYMRIKSRSSKKTHEIS